jgi:GMP synthase-like glutamine amidotransferase
MVAPMAPDRCVVLQHAPTEGPHRLAELLAEAGLTVEVVALDRGQPAPRALPAEVPLVVMGGSMGVSDIGDPAFPFLEGEVELLRERLSVGAPVLGVCLGAQLLAHAAFARVFPNSRSGPQGPTRVYEVGWGPVDFLPVADEPALAGLGRRAMMLHWHGDTFDLPAGAVHLASTVDCPNQAFRLGRAFGVQFHPEMDAATIAAWLESDAAYVERACGPGGADRIRAETPRLFPEYAAARDRLLRNLVQGLVAR